MNFSITLFKCHKFTLELPEEPGNVRQQECSAALDKYLNDRMTFKEKFDVFLYWRDEGQLKYPNVARLTRKALACLKCGVRAPVLQSRSYL